MTARRQTLALSLQAALPCVHVDDAFLYCLFTCISGGSRGGLGVYVYVPVGNPFNRDDLQEPSLIIHNIRQYTVYEIASTDSLLSGSLCLLV